MFCSLRDILEVIEFSWSCPVSVSCYFLTLFFCGSVFRLLSALIFVFLKAFWLVGQIYYQNIVWLSHTGLFLLPTKYFISISFSLWLISTLLCALTVHLHSHIASPLQDFTCIQINLLCLHHSSHNTSPDK